MDCPGLARDVKSFPAGGDETMLSAIVVIGIASAVIVLVAGALGALPTERRVSQRSFWCPIAGRDVTVSFQEMPGGAPAGVGSCTAFRPAHAVTCQKLCLRFESHPAREALARAA